MNIKIGTRRSLLAMRQTELVAQALKKAESAVQVEIVEKETFGDKNLSASLVEFGGKGAFVTEFEEALLDGKIDIAVHSGKDLPYKIAQGLEIAAVLGREDPRDVLVSKQNLDKTKKLVVGTSSARREIQIKNLFDCEVRLLRGNVPTRLEKLMRGEYDAIILAAAGLKRLGIVGENCVDERYSELDFEFLECEKMLPAGNQGIIAIECRKNDSEIKKILSKLNDEKTFCEFKTERLVLEKLECGCHEPTAVFSEVSGGELTISLLEKSGEKTRRTKVSGKVKNRNALVDELLSKRLSPATVYLLGAGPGDPELISLRGMKLLKAADIIVYDNLANPRLLEFSKKSEMIFVGKLPGKHSMKQDEINSLLVEKALSLGSGKIVRLKGGDPFVFGRGGEEAIALAEKRIPYEVVPGITSAVAALESEGIPLTHRCEARSFHVITGHTADGEEKDDGKRFLSYANLEGTLVFLMGVSNLEKICSALILGGKSPETPVSIVESGTLPRQRRIDGTLGGIVKIAREKNVSNPAVIVVGECARHRFLSNALPLSEKKIAVTGSERMVKKIGSQLRDLGATVCPAPFLKIVPNEVELKKIPNLGEIGWLIFTSSNGVKIFFDWLKTEKIDVRTLRAVKFCVVGSGTEDALREFGFFADVVPKGEFTVEQMAFEFSEIARNEKNAGKIVVLRAENGSSDLNRVFDRNGIPYLDVGIYSTRADDSMLSVLDGDLDVLDFMTFESSSGVEKFFDFYNSKESAGVLRETCRFVCIGRKTASTLERFVEKEKILVADDFTAEGLVAKLRNDTECVKEKASP